MTRKRYTEESKIEAVWKDTMSPTIPSSENPLSRYGT
ncbi:MAG: hypothetical protein ACI9J0_001247 [Cryomorphaceae bacterium]|jgi:hypothetical protein